MASHPRTPSASRILPHQRSVTSPLSAHLSAFHTSPEPPQGQALCFPLSDTGSTTTPGPELQNKPGAMRHGVRRPQALTLKRPGPQNHPCGLRGSLSMEYTQMSESFPSSFRSCPAGDRRVWGRHAGQVYPQLPGGTSGKLRALCGDGET